MAIYKDIDISCKKHPGNKDILKKTDVNSVRWALRHIFLSDPMEKKFDPYFGLGLRNYLFENYSPSFSHLLKRKCLEQIEAYEPRVIVDDLRIEMETSSNNLDVNVLFHTIADPTPQTLTINLERAR